MPFFGTAGNDTFAGGNGHNSAFGFEGDDSLFGNGGDDTLFGGLGTDFLVGGAGDDTIQDESGFGQCFGLAGDDIITVFGNPNVFGGDGADLIKGEGVVNHFLRGDAGDDTILAGDGDDDVAGGLGANKLDGGTGVDLLTYEAAGVGVMVDLAFGTATGAGLSDAFEGFEDLRGSGFGDSLKGDTHDNHISGEGGGDTIRGGGGRDVILGDGGDDLIYASGAHSVVTGGDGNDFVILAGGGIIVGDDGQDSLGGGYRADTIGGGAGQDLLNGFAGEDTINGGNGADTLIGGADADSLTGGGRVDTFRFNLVTDSAVGAEDLITDLADFDVIDLSGIDANESAPGDQAFQLVAGFSKQAGEAVLTVGQTTTTLSLDVDSDGIADSVIVIAGAHGGFTNFVL